MFLIIYLHTDIFCLIVVMVTVVLLFSIYICGSVYTELELHVVLFLTFCNVCEGEINSYYYADVVNCY